MKWLLVVLFRDSSAMVVTRWSTRDQAAAARDSILEADAVELVHVGPDADGSEVAVAAQTLLAVLLQPDLGGCRIAVPEAAPARR